VADLGTVEQAPQQDGRNMTMLLAPLKRKPQEQPSGDGARADQREDVSAPAAEDSAPAQAENNVPPQVEDSAPPQAEAS
jgi:translation initiation factor IF-3